MLTSFLITLALSGIAFSETYQQPTLNISELGFFEPASIEIHAVGKHYLFSTIEPGEEALKIADRKGQILYSYEKSGQGPEELKSQGILGVSSNRIYVYSRSAKMMVFDHQLNLIKQKKATKAFPFPFNSSRLRGIYTKQNQLLILSTIRSDYFVSVFSFEDQGDQDYWQPISQQLIKETPFSRDNSTKALFDEEKSSYHGDVLFTYRLLIKPDRDHYSVLAHRDFNGTWKPVAELYNDVEGFDLWLTDTIAIVSNIFVTTNGGYAVEFATKKDGAESPTDLNYYIDLFDENSKLLKRVNRGSHRTLKIANTAEIYSIENQNEDDILVPFFL